MGIRWRWWLLAILCLAACSHPAAEPAPTGLAGLRLGDPPPAGLVAAPVVLPSELAGDLAYFTRPGRTESFRGAGLADPVYGFYRQRLFSVAADLTDAAEAPRLRRELEAAYGAPFCRETAGGRSCLWRRGDIELVLAIPAESPPRLLLRSTGLAGELLHWREQSMPLERGGDGG